MRYHAWYQLRFETCKLANSYLGSLEDLHLLAKLLPNLDRLQTFVYVSYRGLLMTNAQFHSWEAQYQIPSWLLDGLCKGQPQCRLFLRLPFSSNIAHSIARIRDCQQLCSLEVTIANSQHQAFAELDQLLAQTKTLKSLSMLFFIDDQLSTIPGTSLDHPRICRSTSDFHFLFCHEFLFRPDPISRLELHE